MEPTEYARLYELEKTLWWFRGMETISQALISRYSRKADGKARILDAGCGTGGMLDTLARHGECLGIDFSSEALRFAHKRHTAPLAQASIERLPFKDHSFDLVTSFDVIYHERVTDDMSALKELERVLSPEGLLVLRVPAYDFLRSQHDVAVHTRQRYGRRELSSKLVAAGLVPVHVSFANSVLFPLALVKRLMQRIVPARGGQSEVQALSPILNGIFTQLLSLEARVIPYLRLPFGLSLFAVANKPTR